MYETRNNSDETVAETRCYARRQISEMKDKVHAKFYKAEETRLSSHRQAEEMLAEEKEKVDEVQRLASKNVSENMEEME